MTYEEETAAIEAIYAERDKRRARELSEDMPYREWREASDRIERDIEDKFIELACLVADEVGI